MRSEYERFAARVVRTESCWLWRSARVGRYGKIRRDDGSFWLAHRLSYELYRGEIPGGMDLDHLCRETRCVNPAHLEPVTRRENTRRGRVSRWGSELATACLRGHAYDATNTYVNQGKRFCRKCSLRAQKAYQARKAEVRL